MEAKGDDDTTPRPEVHDISDGDFGQGSEVPKVVPRANARKDRATLSSGSAARRPSREEDTFEAQGQPVKFPRRNRISQLKEATAALDSIQDISRQMIEEGSKSLPEDPEPRVDLAILEEPEAGLPVESADPMLRHDPGSSSRNHEILKVLTKDLSESRPVKAIRKLRAHRLKKEAKFPSTTPETLDSRFPATISVPEEENALEWKSNFSTCPVIKDRVLEVPEVTSAVVGEREKSAGTDDLSRRKETPGGAFLKDEGEGDGTGEGELQSVSGSSSAQRSTRDRGKDLERENASQAENENKSASNGVERLWNSNERKDEGASGADAAGRMFMQEGPRRKGSTGSLGKQQTAARKDKKSVSSIKQSLERKMETVERLLEDRVIRAEKIWEEKREKHPWLQPIDTWISDHRRRLPHNRKRIFNSEDRGYSSDTEIDQQPHEMIDLSVPPPPPDEPESLEDGSSYDFKFTAADQEDEEPKLESRVLENLRRLRRAGSPRPRVSEARVRVNADVNAEDILDVKEVNRHHNCEIFDKLKDNFKEKMDDIHRYFLRTNRLADVNRKLKSQIWSSVVTIVLVEAKNLLPMDIDGLSDPYVKFRLGTEKYKSKVANKTLNPVWLEQFDLHLYEDPYLGQELEVTVWDRDRSHQDDLMGRTVIDLATLERETTHRLWRELEDGSGNIFLLLTISGTTASETISDLAAHEETSHERSQLLHRYSLFNTLQRPRDVGHLIVKVYRGQGLAAADLGGKSDPFCVLELVNARLQTQTEYKTLAPNWQKIFTFNVKDINSVLEVTVYDEDRDHKVEFLGKVAIPLLRIRNGEKRWYALKDKKLRGRAKGNCPQILLEMSVMWNVLRACIRTLNPKEKKYMEPEVKFKRQVFLRNVFRLKAIIIIFIDIGKYIQSCWEWESKLRSVLALVIFVLGCYYFEPWMLPAAALLILLKYYLVAVVTGAPLTSQITSHLQDTDGPSDDGPPTPGDDDDDDEDKDKEEKKSLKERLQAIQEVTQTVQNSIGYLASLAERVKNLFNFTVPYLSYLAMVLAILGCAVLYFIPIRYLILAWGVNKFSRKIIRPHTVPNNEVLDLVSRVPDDEELLNYRELKPIPTADCDRGGGSSGSPGGSGTTRREQRKKHKGA